MASNKQKYQQKKVKFKGENLVLYSIDGVTWSSRKSELEDIADRHEEERLIYGGQIKSGPQAKRKIKEEAEAARQKKANDAVREKEKNKKAGTMKQRKVGKSKPKKVAAKSKKTSVA